MKQFFKFTLASLLGFMLAMLLCFFIFIGIIMTAAKSSGSEVEIPPQAVLHLKLDKPIMDRTSNEFGFTTSFKGLKDLENFGLNDYKKALRNAQNDEKIKGIFLDLSMMQVGIANLKELRNEFLEFKNSGKFIVAYAENYSQAAYYVASIADEVYINPEGSLVFQGLQSSTPFFKGLLAKTDIDAQIIRHGKYKSAVEPFMLDKMSEASKEQMTELVDDIWGDMLEQISIERKISKEMLNQVADKLNAHYPQGALNSQLVDGLLYRDEVMDKIKDKLNIEKSKGIKSVNMSDYYQFIKDKKPRNSENEIAVIYAMGAIESGSGEADKIKSDDLCKTIRKARNDKDIKTVVLRVNSPGGSALASEVILRELNLTKEVKPVVVSMSDVAASGGYYISCNAHKIVAQPNTITGSIGVFGVVPNFENTFKNKFGITFDGVKTNENAGFLKTVTEPLSPYEKQVLTNDIERIYDTFITHVSEGRNIPKETVDQIGQGRVWSGEDAKRLGLVDELGGLEKALEIAAEIASIENYKIKEMPRLKEPFEQIMDMISGESNAFIMKKQLGDLYPYIEEINELKEMKGVQARIPFQITIE